MIQDIKYISIKEVLSRTLRHPLLNDVTLEATIQYVIDFIGLFGMHELYTDKQCKVQIEEFRGKLPCDLIAINQVRETKNNHCLRAMTDTFLPILDSNDLAYKVQNSVIFTTFKNGEVEVSYRAIPIDDEGLPLLLDNAVYLKTLDLYIKKEAFTILFDLGKINGQVLEHTEREYYKYAKLLTSELTTPSVDQMESLKNQWCQLISRVSEFKDGFKYLGNKEFLRLQ